MEIESIKAKLYDFFCKETGVISYDCALDPRNSGEIVGLLHMGRISLLEYSDMNAELRDEPLSDTILFDAVSFNPDECLMDRLVIPTGTVLRVSIFAEKDHTWSIEERNLVKGFILIMITLKSRLKMKEFIDYAMFHEMELGLHNSFYLNRMMTMIEKLDKLHEYSIIFFNLVNLTGVNYLLGRKGADRIIIQFIDVIEELLENPECVCRMGGDNFCILARQEKTGLLLDVLKGMHFNCDSMGTKRIKLGAYSGVYKCTGAEKSFSECIDNALATMLIAKNEKHVQVQYYDESMLVMVNETRKVESAFKNALKNGEFLVYYQPKVDLANFRLVGAEALCRWDRNSVIVMPDSFIPILEKSTRICKLDFFVLETVCRDLRSWIDSGKKPVPVSVNFSRKHLSNSDLVEQITEVVDRYRIPHSYIMIEVTETTNESDSRRLNETVGELAENKFEVSVDDFGSGYSSMSIIKDISFKEIKIDRSFLNNKNVRRNDMIMMKHIISMARDLGLATIAEGVETMAHVELLKQYGCFYGQGYLFDKPLPKEFFEKVLDSPYYKNVDPANGKDYLIPSTGEFDDIQF